MIGGAVRDAVTLLRGGDARLLGAPAWWIFDGAVLWAAFHALGEPPALPILAFAYFAGQVGNTIPVPGAVSGGMVGTLLAFGVAPDLALSAVLTYRTVAIWAPAPFGLLALGALKARVGRWDRGEDEVVAPAPRRGKASDPAGDLRGFNRRLSGKAGLDGPANRRDLHPGGTARRPRERRRRPAGSCGASRATSASTSTRSSSPSPRRSPTPSCTPTRAADGTVEVRAEAAPYELRIVIRDHGGGIRPGAAGGAGFGLAIIRRLAQHVDVDDTGGGVTLRMTFPRGGRWAA